MFGSGKTSKQKDIAQNYPYRVVLFGARQEINDEKILEDTRIISERIAKEDYILVNGGSKTGLMGYSTHICKQAGGRTHGIGLHRYEPDPNPDLTFWEGYDTHWERQRRLFELGDAYIILPGGIGTLHEAIEAHIMQEIGEMTKSVIFVGEYTHNYKRILDFIESRGLLRNKLPTNLYYAKDGAEAAQVLTKSINEMKKQNYVSQEYYPALSPEAIHNHIKQNQNPYYTLVNGIKMKVLPNVYPSNRFRSSTILAQKVRETANDKKVADIACGHGTMGIVAAHSGASHVVQVDINSQAVKNARENAKLLGIESKTDIYHGDTFTPLSYKYRNYFDIIYFNPPFHLSVDIDAGELVYAFSTKGKEGGVLNKFLKYAKRYLAPGGKVILAFSNKDPKAVEYLESLLEKYGYTFTLEIQNKSAIADNRFYHISDREDTVGDFSMTNEKRDFKLGVILAASGVAEEDGSMMKKGVDLAIRDLALENKHVEVGFHDDQSSPSKVLNGLPELLENFKPSAVIGPTWSSIIETVAPALDEEKITYYTPGTSSESLYVNTAYRISGSYINSSKREVISNFAKDNRYKKFAVVTGNNKWGSEHDEIMKQVALGVGGAVVVQEKIDMHDQKSMKDIVKQIVASEADVVLIDNFDTSFYDFLVCMKKNKCDIPIVGTLQIASELRVQIMDLELSNDIFVLESKVPEDFAEKFKDVYGIEPHRYAFNAYVGTLLLAQAHEQIDDDSSLRDYIVKNMRVNVYGEKVSFDHNGDWERTDWKLTPVEK